MENQTQLLLLSWLHNIYLQPKKFRINFAAKIRTELLEANLVKPAGKWNHLVATNKGKKVLLQNLHLLQEDDKLSQLFI